MNSTKKKKKKKERKKPPSRVGDRNAGSRPQPGFSCQSTLFSLIFLFFLPPLLSRHHVRCSRVSSFRRSISSLIVLATFSSPFSVRFVRVQSKVRSGVRVYINEFENAARFCEFFKIFLKLSMKI